MRMWNRDLAAVLNFRHILNGLRETGVRPARFVQQPPKDNDKQPLLKRKLMATNTEQVKLLNTATQNEDAPQTTQPTSPSNIDTGVIDQILGKDEATQMKEAMTVIANSEATLEAREIAFENLELLVSQVDNANNLVPLGMWEPLLKLLKDPEPQIRSNAALICGTSIQNNPKAQAAFQERDGLPLMLALLQGDNDGTVRDKAMFCVSAFVRQYPPGLKQFLESNGIDIIKTVLQNDGRPRMARRIYFLLATLVKADEYKPHLAQHLIAGNMIDVVAGQIPRLAQAEGAWDALEQALIVWIELQKASPESLSDTLARYPETKATLQAIRQSPDSDIVCASVWDQLRAAGV
ncbi:hsp70 nucleotide exchange factor fes1 [Dispira parvispora]|uniref:Hsp70 nucleotide exchange factor fes1 n=1 Tax=Dispira parvispora TaxID=1520584 RepID=A0A9W8ASU7_9FUNG|nr:hsp70 nucleotide exchange factor fes1 [Dispira parvispora]